MIGQNDVHVPACRYLSNSDFCPFEFSPNLRIEDKALLKHDQHSPRCFSLHSINEDQSFKVGYPNVGKSSLFNAFVGRMHRKLTKESIFLRRYEAMLSCARDETSTLVQHQFLSCISMQSFLCAVVIFQMFSTRVQTAGSTVAAAENFPFCTIEPNVVKAGMRQHSTSGIGLLFGMVKVTPLCLLCYNMPLYYLVFRYAPKQQ